MALHVSRRDRLVSLHSISAPILYFSMIFLCFWTATAAVYKSTTNVFASEDSAKQQTFNNDRDNDNYNNMTQSVEASKNIWTNRQPSSSSYYDGNDAVHSRIIGGTTAKQGRYPAIVTILTEGGSDSMAPACGGTLIAPDIILTAAHCRNSRLRTVQVGRTDRTDPNEDFEIYSIAEQITHPNYDTERLDYDVMILKLSGLSDNPLMSLNRDPTIPNENNAELRVLGFGVTQLSGMLASAASPTLQVGTVQHVPNEICEQASSPGVDESYQGKITEDMLCAIANGVDACQGDSGSALILEGETSWQDVQVGVTSWGYRCAHPDFPGVYSRVSYLWDWIAQQVCQQSSRPPPAFKCNNEMQYLSTTLVPSEEGTVIDHPHDILQQSQQSSPTSKLVPVTLKILFDNYASEIRWRLKDSDGNAVASVPFDFYLDGRVQAIRTFFLEEGGNFTFMIEDSYRDGLCCSSPGYYMFTTGEAKGKRLLLSGKGDFGATATHEFEVKGAYGDYASVLNIDDGSSSLQSQAGTLSLQIVLQLDDYPSETGLVLERLSFSSEIAARMPAGKYWLPGEEIRFSVELEEDELYRFSLLDTKGNGIEGGRVRLYLGKENNNERTAPIIFDHDGSFTSFLGHSFLASLDQTASSPPASGDDKDFLTLEIRMDMYPEEVGFQVRPQTIVGAIAMEKRASTVIFFRPPGYYNSVYVNRIVQEIIPLPLKEKNSPSLFQLIMMDSFGDGLCCKWQGQLVGSTGYTLYRGHPTDGNVIVASTFSNTAREVYSFSVGIAGELGSEIPITIDTLPSSVTPTAEVPVRVVLRLDSNPYEIGFSIIDVEKRPVVHVPPGSYHEVNTTVQEDHILVPGIYTFSIFDTHGNGIARTLDGPVYELLWLEYINSPTIISGDGDFGKHREHTFVLEGRHASVPVFVKIELGDNDDPAKIGFQVERLDLAEADAVVATIAPGQPMNVDVSVTGSLAVQDEGLYRVSLLVHDNVTFTGSTRIAIGSHTNYMEVDINRKPKFLARTDGSASLAKADFESETYVSLSLPPQINSHDLDWVLLAITLEQGESKGKGYTSRTVIAYGPQDKESLEGFHNKVETIRIPSFDGKQAFMLIISHSDGKECCTGAAGASLIQLFLGPPENNVVLLGTSFEGESRLVEIFHLVGAEVQTPSFVGTGVISLGLMAICGYILYRMYRN